MDFGFLYRPETTAALEELYGKAHTDNCRACVKLFKNFKLNDAERRAVESAHHNIFPLWPHVSPCLQACREVKRWNNMEQRVFRQTSYDHSLTLPVVAAHVFKGTAGLSADDSQYGARKALIHDIGEGLMGDVLKPVKDHPLLKDLYKAVETELTERVLSGIKDIGEELRLIFAEDLTRRGKLFSAVEHADYLLYADAELNANCPHKNIIAAVFRNSGSKLKTTATDSPAISKLLSDRADGMKQLMADHPPETDTHSARVEIKPEYLELMLNAAVKLFNRYAEKHGGAIPDHISRQLLTFYRGYNPA